MEQLEPFREVTMMSKESIANHSLHFDHLLIEKDTQERGYEEVMLKMSNHFHSSRFLGQ